MTNLLPRETAADRTRLVRRSVGGLVLDAGRSVLLGPEIRSQ